MIETAVLKIQIVSAMKLVIAAWLLYIWIPKRVFPQEYMDDSLDRVMFNIIHMVALITLVFPLFIFLKVFGFLFLIIFFIALRLLFIKYYYKRNLLQYFTSLYYIRFIMTLYVLHSPKSFFREYLPMVSKRMETMRQKITTTKVLSGVLLFTVVSYAIYLKTYRGFVSLVAAVPDMYQYYLWGNQLKNNILFSKETVAPYMWSGPVLVYTTNLLANLNAVIMNNLFPFLYTSFMLFSIYYFVRKTLERGGSRTASIAIALIFFGIVIPSPLAHDFFGTIFVSQNAEVTRLPFMSLYGAQHIGAGDYPRENLHFVSYWRLTSSLPYEISASFFLVNILFLAQYIRFRKTIYALLYAETLAIIFSIHGGIAIALLFPSLLIFLYSVVTLSFTPRSLGVLSLAVIAGTIIGNTWILQVLEYGVPNDIGSAAPFLDKILNTKRGLMVLQTTTNLYSVQIISPTLPQFILLGSSIVLIIAALFRKEDRFAFTSAAFIALGTLFLYFQQNIGLPRLVDHSRLQIFVTFAYAVAFAAMYYLLVERGVLRFFFTKSHYKVSVCLLIAVSFVTVLLTPRWIDTKEFWHEITYTEYDSMPYLVYEMEDKFQPFTYTVVSYVQTLPQVVSKGYHINTQDLLQEYDPADPKLKIPTEYVFVFVEAVPQGYKGTGEYWFRWKRDIMLKLKDWVSIYAQHHSNIKLWYADDLVEVYIIDNRDDSVVPTYPVLLPVLTSAAASKP